MNSNVLGLIENRFIFDQVDFGVFNIKLELKRRKKIKRRGGGAKATNINVQQGHTSAV